MSLCEYVNDGRKKRSKELRERLIAYVQEKFSDPQLSLSSAAKQFNMNEAYFSVCFKEQVGKNFSVYLENTRISRAQELLMDSRFTIASIGQMAGYNSDQSFRRAFKRVTMISPSEFRDG